MLGQGSSDLLKYLCDPLGRQWSPVSRADQERVVVLSAVVHHVFLNKQCRWLAHRYLANRASILYARSRVSGILVFVLVVVNVHPVTNSLLLRSKALLMTSTGKLRSSPRRNPWCNSSMKIVYTRQRKAQPTNGLDGDSGSSISYRTSTTSAGSDRIRSGRRLFPTWRWEFSS